LLEIGSNSFDNCYALKSIKIPSTVTDIHKEAFIGCHKLKEVVLCEGLLNIGEYAFCRCTSLERIKIPSTVSIISEGAFKLCEALKKIELNEGLLEIGEFAFYECCFSDINFPSTVKTISSWACGNVLPLLNFTLPDGIESIGVNAFRNGAYQRIRIPPLVKTFTKNMFYNRCLLSLELQESIERVDNLAFDSSTMLRNLALPSNVEIGIDAFKDCLDLKQLGTERSIINALKHRFDNLPIHKILYYQSYNQGRVLRSNNGSLINMLDDPSIKQQDTLGMTPLHILACSTTQNIEIYKMFIDNHPESLITKDRWGAVPLLYAVWGDVDKDIVHLLVQSYKSIFPTYVFNFTRMMEILGQACVDGEMINILHGIQIKHFPDQCIDWDTLLENAITRSPNPNHPRSVNEYTLRCFAAYRLMFPNHLDLLRIKPLLDEMEDTSLTHIYEGTRGRRDFVKKLQEKLDVCRDKYDRIMEALTMIELVLWKNKMDDCCGHQRKTRQSKKMRMDDSDMRKQCRIKCGAETNIVIEHVLPYLSIL